jgi:ribonuclease HI
MVLIVKRTAQHP